MTDEGAKALAIALEKLAAALAGGVHIHVYQQPPSTTQVQPPFPPLPEAVCGRHAAFAHIHASRIDLH